MRSSRRSFIGRFFSGAAGLGVLGGLSRKNALGAESDEKRGARRLPVAGEFDICVLGGSCTGVFAAVRAARLGMKVAIVERQNGFGGVATSALVNVWHSLYDNVFEKKIIAGLTEETVNRLRKRGAIQDYEKNDSVAFALNSPELKLELDALIVEAKVNPYLHTLFSEPYYEDGKLTGVIIDGKSGRRIIKAKVFIDATGDADLCYRMGLETRKGDLCQPPTMCAHINGFNLTEFNNLLVQHAEEFNISPGFVWGIDIPSTRSFMLAGTRITGVDCSDGDDLTRAEIEGRRQLRAMMDLYRKYGNLEGGETPMGLTALASSLGVRESRHVSCLYRVTDNDAVYGKRFEDAIANGSYNIDIHHQEKPGNTFYNLDGTAVYSKPGSEEVRGRWRPEMAEDPTFYQIPLRAIIPAKTENVLVAGRMFDAEMIAFSGMRVMVNMNQLGEAAGVCAALAVRQGKAVPEVDSAEVRRVLAEGGSLII